jgi:hypothetical protein
MAAEIACFASAVADNCHQGVPCYQALWHKSMFVDDNGVLGIRARILEAICNSVASAYLIFGVPENDRQPGCFALNKWAEEVSHLACYLGYDVCTRSLALGWPIPKCQQLLEPLLGFLPSGLQKTVRHHPRTIASVLGLMHNAGFVVPLCLCLSLRLQHWFNSILLQHRTKISSKQWWRKGLHKIPSSACVDLDLMCQNASLNPDDSNWRCYISFIVDQSPNCKAIQDAAHQGLGSWSSTFQFIWRTMTHDEHHSAPISWPMKVFNHAKLDAPFHADGLHINLLEIVALIINMWFVLWATRAFRRMDLVTPHRQHLRRFMAAALSPYQKPHRSWSLTLSHPNDAPSQLSQNDSQLPYSRKGEQRSGLCLMTSELSPHLGIRYAAMLQPTALHGLSSATVSTLHAFDTAFAQQQQGGVRDGNDQTTDSRARHFLQWLDQEGITSPDIATLPTDSAQTVKLIGAFAWSIKQGHRLQNTKNPGAGTVAGYINAAALWLETEHRQTIKTYSLTSSGTKTGSHPLLSDLIATQRAWCKPQKKKEPFTSAIFEFLHTGVSAAAMHD